AAAQDFVEPAHAGGHLVNRDFSRSAHGFLRQFASGRVILLFHFYHLMPTTSKLLRDSCGQTSCTNRSVKSSPIKATSSPSNWASRTTQPSAISFGSTCASSSSNPSKDPSAFTCMARNQATSALASASERARSARKPAFPMNVDRCTRSFSHTRKAAGVFFVSKDLFPLAS